MARVAAALIIASLLVSCGDSSLAPPTLPAMNYGTVVGYTAADGQRVMNMCLYDKPLEPHQIKAYVREGERVALLQRFGDGMVLVRTASETEGWTHINLLKDIRTTP